MDGELAVIDRQRDRWIAAINEGSATSFVVVLTDDVVWLPSRSEALAGKEAIRNWLKEPFAELDYDYTVSEVRVRLAGAWAVEQARFLTKARTKSGEALPVHEGSYTLLWRKTPGDGWLIERYIDHSAAFEVVD